MTAAARLNGGTDAATIAQALDGRRNGSGWMARCPAHDDRNPSLSISESPDGKPLVKCFAGCEQSAVLDALRARGLWPSNGDGRKHITPPAPPKTAATATKAAKVYADIDTAAAACLRAVTKATGTPHTESRRDEYRDATGNPVACVLRFDATDGAGKSYRPIHATGDGWALGDPPGKWPLFNLPGILATAGPVYVCEGEKACDAGLQILLPCVATAHGASAPHRTDWAPVAGRPVIVLPDCDSPGAAYAEKVAQLATEAGAASVRILNLPGLPPSGDLFEFVEARPDATAADICAEIAALAAAVSPWQPAPVAASGNVAGNPTEAARMGKPFALSDLGNAERFTSQHGHSVRWDVARKSFRVWDGRRWAVDDALRVYGLAAKTARSIRDEAAAVPSSGDGGPDLGLKLFQFAVKSESRDRLAAMIEVAKSQPGIAVPADTWDADAWTLNCANGIIDLRTGKLSPHDRSAMLTRLSPVEYHPGRGDVRWERFLMDATGNDPAVIAFLQTVAGYTLTGDTSEEKLFLVFGPEASGKSTFLDALRAVLGDYARTIQPDLLTRQKDSRGAGVASPELAALSGARLAAGSELEQGREVAEALAKNLTGGEPITARHLYAELFDFRPQFKIWLALNHCPKVSADDGAIWRRILRIGFEHTIPPAKRDTTLKPYLRDPAGGAVAVLAWAVAGCLRWQSEGLTIPGAVEKSTADYRAESDPLAPFIEDCLRFNPAAWAPWADIWREYCDHADESGVQSRYRVSPKRLQERLRSHDCESERRFTGRGWRGVELIGTLGTP